jgi:uncharacterized protein YdhG (YjbR/CyaY superfamily)
MKKPATVDEYIDSFDTEISERLGQMRNAIAKVSPGAKEGFKYGQPAFSLNRVLVVYSAYKKHIGYYPTPDVIIEFKEELKEYKTAKGSVQFPHNKPLPLDLIEKMAKFRFDRLTKEDVNWKIVDHY